MLQIFSMKGARWLLGLIWLTLSGVALAQDRKSVV